MCNFDTILFCFSRFTKGCRSRDSGAAQEDVSSHEKKVFCPFFVESFDLLLSEHNSMFPLMRRRVCFPLSFRRGGWLKVLIYCWVNITLRVPSLEKKVQAENLYLRVKPIQGGAGSALPQHFSFSDFDFQSLFFQSVFFQFVFFNVIIFESETNPGGS